jgi:hypothetical protein
MPSFLQEFLDLTRYKPHQLILGEVYIIYVTHRLIQVNNSLEFLE